jgi:predicted GTPase
VLLLWLKIKGRKMSNEVEFKKFIDEDRIVQNDGKTYEDSTKEKRFKMIERFIRESGNDIYAMNNPKEVKKFLEEKKDVIQIYSKNHLKRGIEWYLTFLESKK